MFDRNLHIKRDGGFLCGSKLNSRNYKSARYNYPYIDFKSAHNSQLDNCCNNCKKRYYEIIENMDIVVEFPMYNKKKIISDKVIYL